MMEKIKAYLMWPVVGGSAFLVGAMVFWVGTFLWYGKGNDEIYLPTIIITGVVFLLIVLGLLTFSFSVLGLANRDEPLGLPSGSVRAVIALMLLVVFAIVAIFVYSNVSSSGAVQKMSNVPKSDLESIKKQLEFIASIPDPKNAEVSTVYYRNSVNRAAEDIAKQLIILLGTLVTAVSSFYFGSNSVSSAQAAMEKAKTLSGGPNAETVEPPSLVIGKADQPLKITGSNLGRVNTVTLTHDGKSISADNVQPKDNEVICRVSVPAEQEDAGPWTAELSDSANNYSKVPNAVTLKPA
jgi:hypothetical protein